MLKKLNEIKKNINTKKIKKFAINYTIHIVMIIILILALWVTRSTFTMENFEDDKKEITKMDRPFLNIYDQKGQLTRYIFITHPFSRDDCIENYNKAKAAGAKFIGISSYCDFPKLISNPHDVLANPNHKAWTYNYFDLCRGWCYCFKKPEDYGIPKNYPQILLSESDFAKYKKHTPDPTIKKEYDFLYVCLKDNDKCEPGWQSYNRNWEQAEKCLEIMCEKYHLKGLLIGRVGCKVPGGCHKITDFLPYNEFIAQYNKCRFVFVPNYLDASPRVMTEAICYNLPVLGNDKILGGWKYVTSEVGELFNKKENDFEEVLQKFLKNFNDYSPRDFYVREYDEEKQGKRLLEFVKKCCPEDEFSPEIEYLLPGI